MFNVIPFYKLSLNYYNLIVEDMQEDDTRDVTILGFAIMFGILALHYRRVAIVAGTSFLGSYSFVSGVDHFVQSGFNSIIPKLANGHLSGIKQPISSLLPSLIFLFSSYLPSFPPFLIQSFLFAFLLSSFLLPLFSLFPLLLRPAFHFWFLLSALRLLSYFRFAHFLPFRFPRFRFPHFRFPCLKEKWKAKNEISAFSTCCLPPSSSHSLTQKRNIPQRPVLHFPCCLLRDFCCRRIYSIPTHEQVCHPILQWWRVRDIQLFHCPLFLLQPQPTSPNPPFQTPQLP